MKVIEVVGAVIVKDGLVLCAQRGDSGNLPLTWEFPGGKIEPPETPREALEREIREELQCTIQVGDEITTTVHEYDFATISLTTFYCSLIEGEPRLTEHAAVAWLPPGDLSTLDWAPADVPAVAIRERRTDHMTMDFMWDSPFPLDVAYGYIGKNSTAPQRHNPRLVLNHGGATVLHTLREEIKSCKTFTFSVAFVTPVQSRSSSASWSSSTGSGESSRLTTSASTLPHAFDELLKLSHFGIDVRLHTDSAFHPKGYIFEHDELTTAIVGSSNLTETALATES